jgi:hypothetical protein
MRGIQAIANLPLSDIARFRVGVDYQKRDGYLKNRWASAPAATMA